MSAGETEPRREAGLVDAFTRLAGTLVAGYDVLDLLDELSGDCVTLFAVEAAGLLLRDPRGGLRVVASSTEQAELVELFEVQNDEGPCLDCLRTSTPVSAYDLAHADAVARWPRFAPHAVSSGFHSVHALPMRLRRQTVGALNLFASVPGDLPPSDLRAAQALADVATVSILQGPELRSMHAVRRQLQVALDGRVLVEQAKGVLAERGGLDMAEAFGRLQVHARRTGTRLSEIARGVVAGSVDTTALPGPDGA